MPFKYFDPTNPKLPAVPFWEAHSIASRGRALVFQRTKRELEDILQVIECEIAEFFHREKERAMEGLQADFARRMEEGECLDRHHVTDLDLMELTDVRDRDNTTDLEALQEIIAEGRDCGYECDLIAPVVPSYEIFAILSLAKIDEFMLTHSTVFDPETMSLTPRAEKIFDRFEMKEMAESLLEATDAVGYAEQLRIIDKIGNWDKDQAEDLHPGLSALTHDAVVQIQNRIKAELAEEAARLGREESRRRNEIRHESNRAHKKLVQDDFEKDPYRFSSAEDAADHFRGILQSKGKNYKHRTVTGWIRERARERDLSLRP